MRMPPLITEVSDDEWAFIAPYLALVREDAPQRPHDLRDVFNGLRDPAKSAILVVLRRATTALRRAISGPTWTEGQSVCASALSRRSAFYCCCWRCWS